MKRSRRGADVRERMEAEGWLTSGAFRLSRPYENASRQEMMRYRQDAVDFKRAMDDPEWGTRMASLDARDEGLEQFDFIMKYAEEYAAHHMPETEIDPMGKPYGNRLLQLYAKMPPTRLVEFRLLYGLDED